MEEEKQRMMDDLASKKAKGKQEQTNHAHIT